LFVQKVKTTAPKRYVVRPPQGCIEPGQEASIKLTMVQKDAENLWREAEEERGELNCEDKFLVQTSVVDSDYFKTELMNKDDKAIGTSLQKLWKVLGDEDKKLAPGEKKAIKSSKLQTVFVFPSDISTQPEVPILKSSTTSSSSTTSTSSTSKMGMPAPSSPLRSSPHGSAEAVFAELSALRKKYDDLVAYTVVLTGERDFLQQEVDDKGVSLRKAEAESSRSSGSDTTVTKASESASGFSFIHLIAVALIAFIIGRLIAA